MGTSLITFLGRTPKGEEGYRTTQYGFRGGSKLPPLAFFGWALHKRLQPDRMVILGTSGSMWDHLFEGDFDFGDQAEERRLALVEAVEDKQVTQSQLDALEGPLAEHLGCPVRLQLIPYCRDQAEQVELLRILADNVEPGDQVELDVTHGFRHLPMLGLFSALPLRRVRGAHIRHIWYGAYDPDTQEAPVLDLSGLLNIADWLEALAIYDHSGDYGVFAALLGDAVGGPLRNAAFLESVNRIGQARKNVRDVLKALRGEAPSDDPALSLFRPELERRLSWAEGNNYYDRQRQLCLEYLDKGRYHDAVIFGWEAFTTRLVLQTQGDPNNYQHREEAQERFQRHERRSKNRLWRDYDTLRRLRNPIAHGSQPKGGEVQRALDSAESMEALLRPLLTRLLPE